MRTRRAIVRAVSAALASVASASFAPFAVGQERLGLRAFVDLKAALSGPEGAAIWAQLKGKLTPRMELQVVSALPEESPRSLLLAPPHENAQVVLELAAPLDHSPEPGTWVRFDGVAATLRLDPFHLTLEHGRIMQAR